MHLGGRGSVFGSKFLTCINRCAFVDEDMDKATFLANLRRCASKAHEKALHVVTEELRPPFHYYVLLNRSYDGNPLVPGEHFIPDLKAHGSEILGPMSDEKSVELLWRDGMVPEWINVTLHSSGTGGTFFQLRCCGRFTPNEKFLYHLNEGYPPFHLFGPIQPPDWVSVEQSGRFNLHWHLKPTNPPH